MKQPVHAPASDVVKKPPGRALDTHGNLTADDRSADSLRLKQANKRA